MAQQNTFDIVSQIEHPEVVNAVNQALKEVQTRFDFKGSVSRIDFDKKEATLTLASDNEGKLKSVIDILQNRLIKHAISLQALDFGKLEPAERGTVRQTAKIRQGVPSDKAKEMVRAIKDQKLKANPSIQGDRLRITGRSKDDLQAAIALLRGKDFGLPIQFTNYR